MSPSGGAMPSMGKEPCKQRAAWRALSLRLGAAFPSVRGCRGCLVTPMLALGELAMCWESNLDR